MHAEKCTPLRIKEFLAPPIVCTSPPLLSAERDWAFGQIFRKGGVDRISIFSEGCWEQQGDILQEGMGVGCSFYIKNKLNSEIFKNKKSLSTKMFFCHN